MREWIVMSNRTDPAQLPRGRHNLSREEVVSSQRERMLAAIGVAVAQKGYVHTTVADVIRGAGVSRETFYEHFANKEACFLAAFDAGVEGMLATMREALGSEEDPPLERLDRAVAAYLRKMAAEPAFARSFLIEIYAVGPQAVAQRMELQQRFADIFAEVLGVESEDDRFACAALVAAVSTMVTARVGSGEAGDLSDLHAPLMGLVSRLLGPSNN